jgi:hypothetical protein
VGEQWAHTHGPKRKRRSFPTTPPASATGEDRLAHRISCLRATLDDLGRHRLPLRVITVKTAYAKNGESRSVPMNEVLTTTLQAVRMDMSADGWRFGPVQVSHIDPSAWHLRMRYARRV